MLKSISLKKVASYGEDAQTLDSLKPLNFIFGENGCGKSTIAQFLNGKLNKSECHPRFADCELSQAWREDEQRKLYVYDAEFVRRLLGEPTLNGVFVMGENAPELEKEIKLKTSILQKKRDSIAHERESIAQLTNSLEEVLKKFELQCWEVGEPYKDIFREAYLGHLKPRKNFMKKCIESIGRGAPPTIEELKESAKLYFSLDGRPQEKQEIPPFEWAKFESLQPDSILETPIKGKADTTIAELINSLGNNDWVDQGRVFFNGKTCPFCQQPAPQSLKDDLELYFDKTYRNQIYKLSQYVAQYDQEMSDLIEAIARYEVYNGDDLNYKDLESPLKTIEASIQGNKVLLSKKLKEPSSGVSLKPIEEQLVLISELISKANVAIGLYNGKVVSFDQGKSTLRENVWRYLGHALSSRYDECKKEELRINKEIFGRNATLAKLNIETKELEKEIYDIGEHLKSIAKSANDINSLLLSFGFTSFQIKEEDDQAHYSIVREDGSQANKTLSEGEKTFIAFLYFCQTLKGIDTSNSIMDNKIVVFDDPVSSLDSKVLYVVSALIKELARRRHEFKINQIFLMTHNVYFFKEVTNQNDSDSANSAYWIIRKAGKWSYFECYKTNPVRTSYQMLWEEVIRASEYPDLDIRNTLRRILENYFKMFGGKDKWELSNYFDGHEKVVCDSLLHWTNDGSHAVFDDLFVSQSDEGRKNYLKVFEDIFYKSGHKSHYDMMTRRECHG